MIQKANAERPGDASLAAGFHRPGDLQGSGIARELLQDNRCGWHSFFRNRPEYKEEN